MINAKDLRIGNSVLLGNSSLSVYQIIYDRRNGYSINSKDYKEDFFDPIPLTKEILIKCGFHKFNNAWVQKDFTENNSKFYFSIWNLIDDEFKYNSAEFDIEINSLHQLQNLYFALTGEELEINL